MGETLCLQSEWKKSRRGGNIEESREGMINGAGLWRKLERGWVNIKNMRITDKQIESFISKHRQLPLSSKQGQGVWSLREKTMWVSVLGMRGRVEELILVQGHTGDSDLKPPKSSFHLRVLGYHPRHHCTGSQTHTSSIGVGSIGETPDVSQTHTVANARQQEVQLSRPVSPVCGKVHVQVHIALVTGGHQQVWGNRLPVRETKVRREKAEPRLGLGPQVKNMELDRAE
jgi:hypothetical protein